MPRSCTGRRVAHGLLGFAALAACNDPVTPPGSLRLDVVRAPDEWHVAGELLPDPIVLRVVDEAGAGVPGARVVWSTQDGSVAAADTAGLEGLVVALWRLPLAPGRNVLRAAIGDAPALELVSEGRAFRADVIDAGFEDGCGIVAGDLWCWGNTLAALGVFEDTPQRLTEGLRLVAVAAQFSLVCVLDDQGRLLCWERGSEGAPSRFLPVDGMPALRAIDGGGLDAVCGLARADSTAWCYRLNLGAPTPPEFPTGVWQAAPDLRLLSIATSDDGRSACGLAGDGSAWCWGRGPLGDGTEADSRVPVRVASLTRFLEITAGYGYACGNDAGFTVHCWGRSIFPTPALVPRTVPGLAARQMSAGYWNIMSMSGGTVTLTQEFSLATSLVEEMRSIRPLQISNDGEWCLLDTARHVYCSVDSSNYPFAGGQPAVRAVPPAE